MWQMLLGEDDRNLTWKRRNRTGGNERIREVTETQVQTATFSLRNMGKPRKLKKVRKGRIHLHCHQGFSVHLSTNDHISLDFCAPKLHNKKQTLSSKMPSLWYVVKAPKES